MRLKTPLRRILFKAAKKSSGCSDLSRLRRAQIAIEFLAVFGFLLFVFVLLQALFINARGAAEEERQALFAQKAVKEIASKINLVSESAGLTTQFEVTPGLGEQGLLYTITVTNSTVSVSYDYGGVGKGAAAPVRVRSVNNGSGATAFNLSSGIYWVNNTGETVYVVKKA